MTRGLKRRGTVIIVLISPLQREPLVSMAELPEPTHN
jgi:hypothetical protein